MSDDTAGVLAYISNDLQRQVLKWTLAALGEEETHNKIIRSHRFLEEALELCQAIGATRADAYSLVDYVYNRPVGDVEQELGGALLTLVSVATALKRDAETAGWLELRRVWEKIDAVREKAKSKRTDSALPGGSVDIQYNDGRPFKVYRDTLAGRILFDTSPTMAGAEASVRAGMAMYPTTVFTIVKSSQEKGPVQ